MHHSSYPLVSAIVTWMFMGGKGNVTKLLRLQTQLNKFYVFA